MLDFLYWFFSQFFNVFSFLDSIILFNSLSLLKLLFILVLFIFILNVLFGRKGGK